MSVKRTVVFDDDADATLRKLDRDEMPSRSALINDMVRDYSHDPEAFKRRRKARLRSEQQAATADGVEPDSAGA